MKPLRGGAIPTRATSPRWPPDSLCVFRSTSSHFWDQRESTKIRRGNLLKWTLIFAPCMQAWSKSPSLLHELTSFRNSHAYVWTITSRCNRESTRASVDSTREPRHEIDDARTSIGDVLLWGGLGKIVLTAGKLLKNENINTTGNRTMNKWTNEMNEH